jgi:hypothetical protein
MRALRRRGATCKWAVQPVVENCERPDHDAQVEIVAAVEGRPVVENRLLAGRGRAGCLSQIGRAAASEYIEAGFEANDQADAWV